MEWGLIVLAYLLGCIPFGLIVARAHNVNLRAQGSGNIGATNALRVLGKKAGALTLAGDMLKGVAAVLIALRLSGPETGALAAGAAVLGHDFPVFTGFRGGKGVATSLGVMVALAPLVALSAITVWLASVAIWRISSVGALVSFALLPIFTWYMEGEARIFGLSLFLAGLIYIKHRENISRLVRGEESRIGNKQEKTCQ